MQARHERFSPGRRKAVHAVIGLAALMVLGCGSSDPPLINVTGTVTFNGSPARAEVIFEPLRDREVPGGRASSGWTRDDGRYDLEYNRDRRGAVLGKHRVRINVLKPLANAENTSYEDATSPVKTVVLLREVTASDGRFDFPLSW